jgi:cytidylate kinase
MVVTIDGPVASGKSTLARLLAEKLGIYYLGTGFLYRGLAYALVTQAGYTQETIQNPQVKDVDLVLNPHRFSYSYDAQNKERVYLMVKILRLV